MTGSRVVLRVALIVAGFLLAQSVLVMLINLAFLELTPGLDDPSHSLLPDEAATLIAQALRISAFGLGVFLSLRFIVVIDVISTWKRVIIAGVVATVVGAAVVVVLGIVEALVSNVSAGAYPFGYSFDPSLNSAGLSHGLGQAFSDALGPLTTWITPVVLASVLLRVWLRAHPAPTTDEAKDHASVAA